MADILFELNGVKLTTREIDVIACIISGHSCKAIAMLLGISVETLHSHVKHIKYKTKCPSKDALVYNAEASPLYRVLKKRYAMLIKLKTRYLNKQRQHKICHRFYG